MANSYAPGSTVRILASLSNAGVYYDPAMVAFAVIGPASRAEIAPFVVKDSVGQYHADVIAADPGLWQYRVSASAPSSAAEGTFVIRASSFVA
jgi:hypothetical protein